MKFKFVILVFLALLSIAYAESNNSIRAIGKYSEFYVTDKNGITLYKEPNINSKKEIIIPYGTKVKSTKMSIQELWLYINWNGHEGWTSDESLSQSKPLPVIPKNTVELKKLLTSGYFSLVCGISIKLNEDGTGGGDYDYCAGGEPPYIKSIIWKGNNPFYVTIITSTPIDDDSKNKGYSDSTETVIIRYNSLDNTFSTDVEDLTFKYKSKP